MITYKLTTPVNVGTLTQQINVSSLAVTGVLFSTKPDLAPIGAAQLTVTLTDTVSGWQEVISYTDASVPAFFSQAAPVPFSGETVQDVMAQLIFAMLAADGKIPAGTITYSTTATLTASATSAAPGTAITLTATVASENPAQAPTGTVTFMDGATVLGTATPSNGIATLSVSTLAAGSHSITANLAATSGMAAATSAAVAITIT